MSTAEKIRYAWQKIPQATNIYSPSGDTIFPKNLEDDSGGMISAHLMSIYSLDQLEKCRATRHTLVPKDLTESRFE